MVTEKHTLLQTYSNLTSFLVHKSFVLACVCLVLMVIPVVASVLLRSVSTLAIPGVIEIEELLLLLLVFFSLADPQMDESHINVDLLYPKFALPVRRSVDIFHWMVCLILICAMTWEVFLNALEKMHIGEFTPELYISTGPFYLLAGLGLFLLCMALLLSLLNALSRSASEGRWIGILLGLSLPFLCYSLPWILEDSEFAWDFLLTGGCAFLFLILFLLLRMPIGYSMSFVGLIGLMVINENHLSPLSMMGIGAPHTAMSYTMSVIPLFILMGELALHSGISKDLFAAASKWLGKLPGGLAIASVCGCAGFAAICGDSLATALTMSSVALPEMKSRKYSNGLACATLAAGGTLGILIPPSVGFIFYAIITEESLGKLFIAGVIPGLFLAFLFSLMLYFLARRYPELAPRGQSYPLKERLASLVGILPMLGLIVLVLGGILAGIFSPTEGGAIGAAGTFIYAVITHKLSWKTFKASLRSTVGMTTKLMFIMIGVNLLGYFLAATQIPFELADLILGVTTNKWLIFLLIIALYVVLGCMLNVIPMILLTLPAIYPTVLALGFDPIWFGVVTVLLMEMGQITPPMGLVVFAIAGMPEGAPMASIFKYVFIFVFCMLLTVFLLAVFPQLALFLPSLLM